MSTDLAQVTKGNIPIIETTDETGRLFSDELKKQLLDNDSEKLKDLTNTLVRFAMSGDVKAIALIIDRLEGKSLEKIEITADIETKQLVMNSNELLLKIRKVEESEEKLLT